MQPTIRSAITVLLLAATLPMGGCIIAGLASALGQSAEYQKLIEVPAQYSGLHGKSVAVIADADYSILFDHPDVVAKVMAGVSARINQDVQDAQVLSPQTVMAWQYTTPQWTSMPMQEIARSLKVERVVYVELLEYRLHPAGNRWLWEGVCDADVGVIEADGFDVDSFAQRMHVRSAFPDVRGVSVDSASANQIEQGLLISFVRDVTWLFHDHEEPKYPDKYQPEGR